LDVSRHLFEAGPNVMLGDFNSHSLWDKNYPKEENHSALLQRLEALGLTSAYHHYHAEPHGSETRPTFFEYRHQHRPYHIDYCFLPKPWARWIDSVTVGTHADWVTRSDHMPVITALTPAEFRRGKPGPKRGRAA
jgi:endonuclease/exonuclease/phosphatase family metal-dependent hydrolase